MNPDRLKVFDLLGDKCGEILDKPTEFFRSSSFGIGNFDVGYENIRHFFYFEGVEEDLDIFI